MDDTLDFLLTLSYESTMREVAVRVPGEARIDEGGMRLDAEELMFHREPDVMDWWRRMLPDDIDGELISVREIDSVVVVKPAERPNT